MSHCMFRKEELTIMFTMALFHLGVPVSQATEPAWTTLRPGSEHIWMERGRNQRTPAPSLLLCPVKPQLWKRSAGYLLCTDHTSLSFTSCDKPEDIVTLIWGKHTHWMSSTRYKAYACIFTDWFFFYKLWKVIRFQRKLWAEVDLATHQNWKSNLAYHHRMFVDSKPITQASDVETLWAWCALKRAGS